MAIGARALSGSRPLRNLPRGCAGALLVGLALALAWSAWAVPRSTTVGGQSEASAHAETAIGDFALYANIAARVAAGENYYAAALAEQRAHNYPTTPFVTVRLPTLAWVNAALGTQATWALTIALLLTNTIAWSARLKEGSGPVMQVAVALLVLAGGVFAFEPRAGLLHELIAGSLLSLALALWRPDRWWRALPFAALALAVRELALPFALLWLAFALCARSWREAGAVALVIALFVLGLALHAEGVAAHASPLDRPSPGWTGLAGPQLALLSLARLTALLALPLALAAPLALLPLLGWAGLGGRLGPFASLWFAGFALAVSVFARSANFYWVMLVLPAYLAGLALVPRALADLLHALNAPSKSQS